MIKQSLRRLFASFGYELRRTGLSHTNCWTDVARLLRATQIPVIVDVGANKGQTCAEIRHVIPDALIHCIEPDPQTFGTLCSNVGAFAGVTTWQLAMGNSEGVVMLNQNTSPDTNSFLRPSSSVQQENWRDLMALKAETPVSMTTLSSWCKVRQLTRVHLLKTDCQGYDLNVLKGAEPLLSAGNISLLLCEVLLTPLYEQQAWFDEIMRYTRSFGYRFHGLYDVNYDSRGDIAWADALFVHESVEPA